MKKLPFFYLLLGIVVALLVIISLLLVFYKPSAPGQQPDKIIIVKNQTQQQPTQLLNKTIGGKLVEDQRQQNQQLEEKKPTTCAPPPPYEIGVNYHSYTANFDDAFIAQYDSPVVRGIVRSQVQQMAEQGISVIFTHVWIVSKKPEREDGLGYDDGAFWKWYFPPTRRELANLRQFAEDVANVRTSDGRCLRLDLGFGYLWDADFTEGDLTRGFGFSKLSQREFSKRITQTYESVARAVTDVYRPDGIPVVDNFYFDTEAAVGLWGKPNEDWLLKTHYAAFVSFVSSLGMTPSLYFLVSMEEALVLGEEYEDPEYPVLNGRGALMGVYRSLKFLQERGLPIPKRIDFSYYPEKITSTYPILIKKVFDDLDVLMETLGIPAGNYGITETYYFPSAEERQALGDAFAEEYRATQRSKRTIFWTTPDGGGDGIHMGFPFAVEDYQPMV